MKKVRKFIYKNLYWLRAAQLAFLFGYSSSLFIETPRPFGLFLMGATVVFAAAFFIAYFNQWKKYRFYDGGDTVWFMILCAFWVIISVGQYLIIVFPNALSTNAEKVIDILWFSVIIGIYMVPHFVFQSWKSMDYWTSELIKNAQAHLESRQTDDNQAAIRTTKRILHILYAIKNKDSRLKTLIALLEHEHDGVKAWAARFLLQYGKDEKMALRVFKELAKKESYIGESAQKVLVEWENEKKRRIEEDTLYENTPLIPE